MPGVGRPNARMPLWQVRPVDAADEAGAGRMGERLLPGILYRESQFQRLPDGTPLTGACGPNALAMGLSWVRQEYHGTVEVMRRMRAASLCAANGITTLQRLREAAESLWDLRIAGVRPYGEPWPDFAPHLTRNAGRHFMCLNVTEGWALVDTLTGEHENAILDVTDPRRLRYHLLGMVGRHQGGHSPRANRELPAGWWCVDGATYSGAPLVFFADAVLAAAQPCGAFALVGGPAAPDGDAPDGDAPVLKG